MMKNLMKHGFDVIKVSDRLTAFNEIMRRITFNKTVGIGGSVTLR